MVIGFFCACMFGALVITLMNPSASFATMPVLDESAMLVHNGQNHRFTQATNEFFADWTISDSKKLFEIGLSDNPNLENCRSAGNLEMVIPESYDWREETPECVKEVRRASQNCTSSYIHSALSAVEDRICKNGKREKVTLSSQEIIDCDKNSECNRGTVNKVLTWGKRRGFVPESCYPSTGKKGECPEEHLQENECRQANNIYKVVDFCIAQEIDGIKREILTNGPVLGQMTPNTDLLTYSEGVYMRTPDAFRFQGHHVFKVVGWEETPDGSNAWIVENTWGSDWGQDGYARIASSGETQLDFFAIGLAVHPQSMADYYAEQQARQ